MRAVFSRDAAEMWQRGWRGGGEREIKRINGWESVCGGVKTTRKLGAVLFTVCNFSVCLHISKISHEPPNRLMNIAERNEHLSRCLPQPTQQ